LGPALICGLFLLKEVIMPLKVEGSNVLHEKDGKWTIKQKCKSHSAALRAMALLRGIEHGWKPTGQKS